MTRKDYVLIAAALRDALKYCETDNQARGVQRAVGALAVALASDNAQFDRQRFVTAATSD